jgi:hypothetical protein
MSTAHLIVDLSDADLLARMRNFEDHLVERKTVKDEKDWRKSAVAFANSAPVALPAVLYIGVRDNGEIETPQRDLDEAQRRFNAQMRSVYPRIAYIPKIISDNGRQALAIIIPGSALRPHFAGLSYVRRGSETIEASELQMAEFIARRDNKANLILDWKDKEVTVADRVPLAIGGNSLWTRAVRIADCNQFYVTLSVEGLSSQSLPLRRIEVNYDNQLKRLELVIAR